jgi:threonine-phosphate decarboxylase
MTDRNPLPHRTEHGGRVRREKRQNNRDFIDFSASLNPFPPRFEWDVSAEDLGAYPDEDYTELREAIGRVFSRKPQEIIVGNGSIELIRVFCFAVLEKGTGFFVQNPTFGEYALSACLAGAHPAAPAAADVAFVCNPNNPTGTLLHRGEILRSLHRSEGRGAWLFLDEAFIELADPRKSCADTRSPSLFVSRSLTKAFAVPGLRMGYGFGPVDLIERMEVFRPPWSVNAYAEAFALEAFRHFDELADSRAAIARERAILCEGLACIGLPAAPSRANYLLIDLPVPAPEVCACLAAQGILVRDCTSFGLPRSIRVAVRDHDENRCLLEALSRCLR